MWKSLVFRLYYRSHGHSYDHVTFLSCWLSQLRYKNLYINTLCLFCVAFHSSAVTWSQLWPWPICIWCALGSQGGNIKAHRGKNYGQKGERRYLSVVRLYPNDCSPIRKWLCDYTRFEAFQNDRVLLFADAFELFQSTPLREGRPTLVLISWMSRTFQSTLPRGERPSM